ncbi:MAG: FHA domain-containing protein [Lachnospiraceae bacterium]|nr:FHA domain-containing protein [Lachnospiraceae bacterium]
MLEAKYYKDYRHNYMILQCSRRQASGSYQHKILMSGKIGEILKCSVRHINGMVYYYYDISSKTTLEGLYKGRKMSCEQVKDILWQLHGICDRLSGYFMDETGLVLQPEHIYYDITDKKYIGLYYPEYAVTAEEAYRPLMDFLLEHIDPEDQKLTEDMYRIYEMSEEGCFSLEDALQILEEVETLQEQTSEPEFQPVYEPMGQSDDVPPIFDVTESVQPVASGNETPRRIGLFYPVFAILSMLSIAGASAVWYLYELTQREEIILGASAAAMGLCFVICLLRIVKSSKNPAETKKNGREVENKTYPDMEWGPEEGYLQEKTPVSLEHVISRDMDLNLVEYATVDSASGRMNRSRDVPLQTGSAAAGQPEDGYGNTVFYDESKFTECKLYAMDRKNKQHIELKKFPCTIGKMAGCVDYVLADNSVSRIHARFDREGERVLLTDMNSTNGTYRNGLRMQPQETVEIEAGDEIRFGNLNYCYR